MRTIRSLVKRLMWPGPDYGTRVRYGLRRRLLRGEDITTLDLGCGNGCLTMAAARVGKLAVGVSTDEAALDRAREFQRQLGLGPERCRFEVRDIRDLATSNLGTFDQVILFEVLEHLMDDDNALATCADHLKPGGWIHLSVPNRDSHLHFEGISPVENGSHVRHGYDFPTLEAMLRRHGLEPIDRLGVGRVGTVFGFLVVAKLTDVPVLGPALGVIGFFLVWPVVQILNLLPCRPWSLYVLAAKRGVASA